MANKYLNKPIVELEKPGGKIKAFWKSAKEASEFHNIHPVNISYNVNGKTKQAKGKYFRFATKKEIEAYLLIQKEISPVEPEKSALPIPIPLPDTNLPVDIIPENPQSGDNQIGYVSPFEKMLQDYKKKFNENSE